MGSDIDRRPSPDRRENARRELRRKKRRQQKIVRSIVFLAIILVIFFFSFQFMKKMMSSPDEEVVLTGQTVSVTIPAGSSTKDIAEILKENKLIGSVMGFRISSRLDGYDGTYQQGTYDIDTGLTKTQIMDLLQTGVVQNEMKLTVPEGYNTMQIAERIEGLGFCTAQEFIDECNNGTFDYDFVQNLPDRENKLEGYLFPDTYFLSEEMTVHDVVNMMLRRFDSMYTEEYKNIVAQSSYTLDELVTIASVVEKEIVLDEERARAAGVIYNRLNESMPLQIDATVIYAMGIVKEDISTTDLQIDSPYNTYKVAGLPLGPISNPGEASFSAALTPETHKYIYYVLEAKGQSNHVYCETYDDFLKAKANYKASKE